jgi:hypothetical protein
LMMMSSCAVRGLWTSQCCKFYGGMTLSGIETISSPCSLYWIPFNSPLKSLLENSLDTSNSNATKNASLNKDLKAQADAQPLQQCVQANRGDIAVRKCSQRNVWACFRDSLGDFLVPLRSTYAQRKIFSPYALPYVSRLGPHSQCHTNACAKCPTYDVGGPSCQCMCEVPNLRCGRAVMPMHVRSAQSTMWVGHHANACAKCPTYDVGRPSCQCMCEVPNLRCGRAVMPMHVRSAQSTMWAGRHANACAKCPTYDVGRP